ncbi:UPF0182 family protein [Zhihengliuella halotolerans]|uniref:UPF0182 protein EV380_0608 n=1 Tax=Zhihengliuella halotolerans TaxID=370736 RepID=A0A4Q8ABV6_9MICC|nr:UPF0182 family protein [Zhihengliuella halotolerans]RZU61053.1 hypothetical protein EV380_0608 [Zhihengliuella halotolerans]
MTFGSDFPFGGRPPGDGGSNSGEEPPERPARKSSALMPTIVVVGVLVAGFVFFANTYAEILWFNQLGYSEVFWTEKIAKIVLWVVAFLIMGLGVWGSLTLAYRSRPVYASAAQQQDVLSKYQTQLEPIRRLLMIGVPGLLAAFSAAAIASQWQTIMLYLNQVDFGEADPEFGLDLSFFLNTLPFVGLIVGYGVSVVLIAGIAGLLMHYLYGGIRIEERGGITVSKAARVHICVTAAIFVLLQAVNYWLDRYSTLLNQDGRVAGAMYTDVNAVIPTKTILAVAAVIVAVLFILGAILGRWKLPIIGTAMLIVTALVAGGVYPFIVQQYQVLPSEKTVEQEYIAKNIEMTRQAYGLDKVEAENYDATTDTAKNALAKDSATTANIRLLDPNLISDAFRQLQQFRPYYSFAETLNVDRYEIDGEVQDTVIAVREVDVDPADSWINQHITYTHGYGVVAAYGAKVAAGGRPDFMLGGIPTRGDLTSDDDYEPRIYFGEESPQYSVVGGPEGWAPRELDRPQDESGEGDAKTTFAGDGGPSIGNFFNRLVYALKFGSTDLLLSSDVNDESQILYDRTPKERIQKVAPYLTVDSNAYPAIVDGRVKWIVDAYTTSNNFPYSQSQQIESAVTDSLTGAQRELTASGEINYIRNSVKATVDAYDGSVDLYAWEPDEPLLQAWQKVFPESIKPYTEMSADLMSHVRYPEDIFKMQRELLGKYHVTNPDDFYEANDAWSVPSDPTVEGGNVAQPPYYLSLKMPNQENQTFSLTSTFIPRASAGGQQRNVLYGFLSAEADAGREAGVKADGYGTLRLLELPRSTVVPGPGQAQQNFDSNTEVSRELNLLRQGASNVINGNMISLPVGGGILHVQPVYVRSTGDTSYPTLRKVLVSFGDKVGFADTLSEALDQLFEGASGATTGEEPNGDGDAGSGDPDGSEEPAETTAEEDLREALAAANSAIAAGQAALAEGDFAAYGQAQEDLNRALEQAIEAEAEIAGTAPVNEEPAEDEATGDEAPADESAEGSGDN